MNAYEQRQEARRARLEKAAERAAGESAQAFAAADSISERFAGGQPILVGHHSEKRARRDQDRMHGAMDRGLAAGKRAKDLSARAAAVGGAGISSDDPEALPKLRARAAELAAQLERVKVLRKAMRGWEPASHDAAPEVVEVVRADLRQRCAAVSATEDEVRTMASCLRAGQDAVPAYMVTSPRENLRRVQERIAQLEAKVGAVYPEPVVGFLERDLGDRGALLAQRSPDVEATIGYRIECDADENRVTVAFENRGVPRDVIQRLKSAGFHYSPTSQDWRRMISSTAWFLAQVACRIDHATVAPFNVKKGEADAASAD